MGNPKDDWGPTRDPRRNAQIRREVDKQAAIEAAYLKHLQAFRERRAQNLPGIAMYINQQIPILLGAWQQQVDNAITDAVYPIPHESQVFWWIALGGNLLWAATSLLDPAVAAEQALIILMSHVGGIAAAGAAKKAWGEPDSPEGAKEKIRQQIAKARGELDKYFQEKRREWGSRFERLQDWDQSDDILLDQFNAYIWKQMFPSIPYDADRFDRIRLMAVEAVQSAVADYTNQWIKFERFAAYYGEKERKRHNIGFRPVLRISFGGKPLWSATDVASSKFY
jgi:hypothetical protein